MPADAPAGTSVPVKSIFLKHYVDQGEVKPEHFRIEETTLDTSQLEDGAVIVQLLYLSVDPYMRMLMKDIKGHYTANFKLDQPIVSGGVARVTHSKSGDYKQGDVLTGRLPWQTHFKLSADELKEVHKVDAAAAKGLPLSYFLGTLGMPGLTAYSALKKIGEPKEGETVYVTAAAGAVGQVVCQLAKNVFKCRVVASAGSGQKVKLLQDFGVDAAFNYKEKPYAKAVPELCPDGIDVDFEQVGGENLDVVLDHINVHGRIIMCGAVSQYELAPEQRYGVKNLFQVVGKQVKMQGFIVATLSKGMEGEFTREMSQWIREGKVKVIEDVTDGFENAGKAFGDMMRGENLGKAVVKVAE